MSVREAALLKRAGLRVTRHHIELIRLFKLAKGPSTHAEVCADIDGVARETVFRSLNRFVEVGLLRRTDAGHTWRFELASASGRPKFVCTGCNSVSYLPEGSVTVSPMASIPGDQRLELQVRGLCHECYGGSP